jgi:hypothetical protein
MLFVNSKYVFLRELYLSEWQENRKQLIINSIKLHFKNCLNNYNVCNLTVFRLQNKSGLIRYMNEFVYWAFSCVCVYIFRFMAGCVFTWSLHRLLYDMLCIQKLLLFLDCWNISKYHYQYPLLCYPPSTTGSSNWSHAFMFAHQNAPCLSLFPYVPYTTPVSFSLIWSPQCLARRTNEKVCFRYIKSQMAHIKHAGLRKFGRFLTINRHWYTGRNTFMYIDMYIDWQQIWRGPSRCVSLLSNNQWQRTSITDPII